jgi:CheY-like chemotaxis protein
MEPSMDRYQQEHGNRAGSSHLHIHQQPYSMAADESAPVSYESTKFAGPNGESQFRFRILVVDDEPTIRETARSILEGQGYEVLTAADGVAGLHSLSQSLPDLIISDLNMPRMSGFEFLAVVRQRFPHIATIAMSGGYGPDEIPSGVLADAFLQKGNYTIKELSHEVGKLLAASPLRAEGKKADVAPLFVLRDSAGYLIITCPKCLRANELQAMSLNGGLHQMICQSCGMPVRFEINHEVEPRRKSV